MDENFKTLTYVYNCCSAFRIAIKSLHKAHNDFIIHNYSNCYAVWNDEAVEFCKGVLFSVRCNGFIDSVDYNDFVCVLNRYKSYNCKKSKNINIYDLLHDFYCSDAENCDRFEYKHFPADELRACYNCVHYACCDERG